MLGLLSPRTCSSRSKQSELSSAQPGARSICSTERFFSALVSYRFVNVVHPKISLEFISNTIAGASTIPKNFDLNENLTLFGTWIISDSGSSI